MLRWFGLSPPSSFLLWLAAFFVLAAGLIIGFSLFDMTADPQEHNLVLSVDVDSGTDGFLASTIPRGEVSLVPIFNLVNGGFNQASSVMEVPVLPSALLALLAALYLLQTRRSADQQGGDAAFGRMKP